MGFVKEVHDGITIIKLEDERLDSLVSPHLKSELLVLSNEGTRHVIIDLSQVSYADSSGLGALLFGSRQLKANDGQIRLLSANERIMNLVRIARLEGHLLNFKNKQDALASFQK